MEIVTINLNVYFIEDQTFTLNPIIYNVFIHKMQLIL